MFNLYSKSLLKDTPNWLEIEREGARRGKDYKRKSLHLLHANLQHTHTLVHKHAHTYRVTIREEVVSEVHIEQHTEVFLSAVICFDLSHLLIDLTCNG